MKSKRPVQGPQQGSMGEMPAVVLVEGLLSSLFTSRNRKSIELARMRSVTLHWKIHSKYILLDDAR